MAEKPVKRQRRYLSYLLRLWREDARDAPDGELPRDDQALWRVSLESPQSDERQGFASLGDLFIYLENETKSGTPGLECPDEVQSQPPAILE